jgi:hypothetical protein
VSHTERFTVTKSLAFSPSAVFAVISDPKGHVDIDGSGTLVSAEDQAPVSKVGDVFVIGMNNPAFGSYSIENHITVHEPDSALEWRPKPVGGDATGVIWGYTLSPEGSGTSVTAYYDWSDASEEMKSSGALPMVSQEQVGETLNQLERVLQAQS